MVLIIIGDLPHPRSVVERLKSTASFVVASYPSGNAMVLSDRRSSVEQGHEGRERAVDPGTYALEVGGLMVDVDPRRRGPATITVGGRISTSTHVFSAEVEGLLLLSDSQQALRDATGAQLDLERLALAMCSNVPSQLRIAPVWRGLSAVPVGHVAVLCGTDLVTQNAWTVTPVDLDIGGAGELVDLHLRRVIRSAAEDSAAVSSDISGGVDSTAIAFVLHSIKPNSFYYHATTADPHHADTSWAERAAAEMQVGLIPLPSFTETTSAFALDPMRHCGSLAEGPPAWAASAEHLWLLLSDARDRGVSTHLNGLGGDELFGVLPIRALSMIRSRHWLHSVRALDRARRSNRWSASEMLRGAFGQRSFAHEIRSKVASAPATSSSGPADLFCWAPGLAVPRYVSTRCKARVVDLFRAELERGVTPLGADRAQHQMMEAIVFQGEVVRQVNEAFSSFGVTWEAPFLDDDLVNLVVGMPTTPPLISGGSKPLLAAATTSSVPRWLFGRVTKGEYSHDLFVDFERRKDRMVADVADGFLVGEGMVNMDRVKELVASPIVRSDDLFVLERLAGTERWARGVDA